MGLSISKLLSFEKKFVSIQALLRHNSIERPITKKSCVTCKNSLNALCEKKLQSSMFKWRSFYYFLEFHCKILNSYAIYCCKKMVKILNCYLYVKKVMALCLRVQFFWPTLYIRGQIYRCTNDNVKRTLNKEKSFQDSNHWRASERAIFDWF